MQYRSTDHMRGLTCVYAPWPQKVTTSAVVPPPALTSEVITPAVELKSSYAGVLTQSLASQPFDAVKVPPQ